MNRKAVLLRKLLAAMCVVGCVAGSFYLIHKILQQNRNFISYLGFRLSDRRVVFQSNPDELLYDRHFLKARLPRQEAVVLRTQFSSKPTSTLFSRPVSPADIPGVPNVPQWQPQMVKKFWSGSFVAGTNGEYQCAYVFDIATPNKPVLYFYAIAFST